MSVLYDDRVVIFRQQQSTQHRELAVGVPLCRVMYSVRLKIYTETFGGNLVWRSLLGFF